jgi:shikimate dehydrogenase
MTLIRLGLICGKIHASRSPALHRFAGEILGFEVCRDLLITPALGKSVDKAWLWGAPAR